MRTNIFYWKYDSPLSDAKKRQRYFKDKYTAESQKAARAIALEFDAAGTTPQMLGTDGNHFAYRFYVQDKAFFLRMDDGIADDEYMLAESQIMTLTRNAGLPVPKVFHTDVSLRRHPVRFQIMEFIDKPTLNQFRQAGTLDKTSIAREMGSFLKRLHAIKLPGYGFFNTEALKNGSPLCGLQQTLLDYFRTRLNDHLAATEQSGLISTSEMARIRKVIQAGEKLLADIPGVLLHRDFTCWNILGSESKIAAVIDWDDAVSADPADDIGMIHCFFPWSFIEKIQASYGIDNAAFVKRIRLHTLRNMLWKTAIRHCLGYFGQDSSFFLNNIGEKPLRQATQDKIRETLSTLEKTL